MPLSVACQLSRARPSSTELKNAMLLMKAAANRLRAAASAAKLPHLIVLSSNIEYSRDRQYVLPYFASEVLPRLGSSCNLQTS